MSPKVSIPDLVERRKALGSESLWGHEAWCKSKISRGERCDFKVVMSTAKNLKFFVKS